MLLTAGGAAARGIAGGITSGVTYFGMLPGGSVPPGTCASAGREPKRNGKNSVAPPATPYWSRRRLVILIIAGLPHHCLPTDRTPALPGAAACRARSSLPPKGTAQSQTQRVRPFKAERLRGCVARALLRAPSNDREPPARPTPARRLRLSSLVEPPTLSCPLASSAKPHGQGGS